MDKGFKLQKLFVEFFESEKAGGLMLIIATVLSLILANSPFSQTYLGILNYYIAGHSVAHWINDGLMVIFFLLIGLELEREIYKGELSDLKNASFPFFAAVGGMLIPAGIFLSLNIGKPTQPGAGIPMATDIAFAIGILSLLGNKVPATLKIFLTAVAVIDDLGAIIVIAIFYTKDLSLLNLFTALGIWGLLFILRRFNVKNLLPYIIGGIIMWYFMLNSGVHATITGVLLAFAIPFKDGGESSPSYKLQHILHKPVAFFILPIFALANTALVIGSDWYTGFATDGSLGIILGLTLGKPIGIILLALFGVAIGLSRLPSGIKWRDILGVGFLAGIGFTMSIFITILAFEDQVIINNSKMAILLASLIAGTIGYLLLNSFLKKPKATEK